MKKLLSLKIVFSKPRPARLGLGFEKQNHSAQVTNRSAPVCKTGNFKNGYRRYLAVTGKKHPKDMLNLHDVMRTFLGWFQGQRCGIHKVCASVLVAMGLFAAGLSEGVASASSPVRVVAASDLKFALARVMEQYKKDFNQDVQVTYGSSGNLARQLEQGLPADMFMSADESLVFRLAKAGKTRNKPNNAANTPNAAEPGDLYALGRLALVVPIDSPLELEPQIKALQSGWPPQAKFAIANPEHAPYGRASMQAMQALGVWGGVQPHLVLGENVAQATQFVASGAAQMGVTALSLAQAPEVKAAARHIVLPSRLHGPLRQRMVLLKGASPQAVNFYQYLMSAPARAMLEQYGLEAPP